MHPDFFPIYERLERLRLPLFLHPVDLVAMPSLGPFYIGTSSGTRSTRQWRRRT